MAVKKSFTFSELMITIGVLGVIAAILLPALLKTIPDKNKYMFQKTYSVLEQGIKDTINDETNYPSDSTTATSDSNIRIPRGFNNENIAGTNVPSGVNKFCYLLSQNVGATGDASVNCAIGGNNTYAFKTSDGVKWTILSGSFPLDASSYSTKVLVDVNGSSTPNCGTGSDISSACSTGTTPDQYEIGVRYDGKTDVTISQNGTPTPTFCGSGSTTAQLNGSNVQIVDNNTGLVCSSYACGTSGYKYVVGGSTTYAYDATAYNGGSNLACSSWACGSKGKAYSLSGNAVHITDTVAGLECTSDGYTCGASGYNYVLNSGTVSAYDSKAYSDNVVLTCNSWGCGAGANGHITAYALNSGTVTKTVKDGTATSLTCSTDTYSCGATSGYTYALNNVYIVIGPFVPCPHVQLLHVKFVPAVDAVLSYA